MHTFLFEYEGIDEFGCIQFCAESKEEAYKLFCEWCIRDNNMRMPVEPYLVTEVYNELDAEEYGLNYKTRIGERMM